MFCSNCGKQILENVKFCNYCGAVQNVTIQKAKDNANAVPEQSDYEVKPKVEKTTVKKAPSKKPILLILIAAVVILLFVFIGRIVGRGTVKPGSDSVSGDVQTTTSEAFEKAWKSAEYGAVYLKDYYSTHAYLNYGTLGLYFETIEDFSLQTEDDRDYLVSTDGQLKISVNHTEDSVPYDEQDEQKCWDEGSRVLYIDFTKIYLL